MATQGGESRDMRQEVGLQADGKANKDSEAKVGWLHSTRKSEGGRRLGAPWEGSWVPCLWTHEPSSVAQIKSTVGVQLAHLHLRVLPRPGAQERTRN